MSLYQHIVGTEQELQLVFQWLHANGVRPSAAGLSPDLFETVVVDGWSLSRWAQQQGEAFTICAVNTTLYEPPKVAPWVVAAIVARRV